MGDGQGFIGFAFFFYPVRPVVHGLGEWGQANYWRIIPQKRLSSWRGNLKNRYKGDTMKSLKNYVPFKN
jgi:hypothetical protein